MYRLWYWCRGHSCIPAPDVTVEICEDARGYTQWRIIRESLYKDYEELLLPMSSLLQTGVVKTCPYNIGTLYPSVKEGPLDDRVQNAKATDSRLPLSDKAAWCFQMASPMAHTHFTAQTFHIDTKPASFLVDSEQGLILIDWEQNGAPLYTLAPEADGSCEIIDVKIEIVRATDFDLIHETYGAPPRKNLTFA